MIQVYEALVFLAPILGLLGLVIAILKIARVRLALLQVLARVFKRVDKSAIAAQCEVFMKPRIAELNRENPEVTLPNVKVQFTKHMPESVIADAEGQVLIVLKESKNRAENLLRITEGYVSKGVMPGGRSVVDRHIERTVDVTIIHRLLAEVDEALRLWQERHYQPCLSNPESRESLKMTSYMDKSGGFLTRLFMPQLELVARRLGFTIMPHVVDESRLWLKNVYDLSLKFHEDPEVHRKDLGEPEFVQPNFGVQTVLVARSSTIAAYDIKRHVGWVRKGLNDPQISEVYVIGFGTETNCYHALRVLGETFIDKRIAEVWPTYYRTSGRGTDNVPVVLVRYIKGPIADEDHKRRKVSNFMKHARKGLKRPPINVPRLLEWLEANGNQYFGTDSPITGREAGTIVKVMNREDMTLEVMDHIFENDDIQLRFEEMLDEYGLDSIQPSDEILYRLYSAMGMDDAEIIPLLDPMVFMSRTRKH
ncbi:MAG: hypothetical protein ACFFD9_05700 [Candidatus Thorarchaeota archaeon]